MKTLSKLRRMVLRENVSVRAAARQLHISRNTAKKWLAEPDMVEPVYPVRAVVPSQLAPYKESLQLWIKTVRVHIDQHVEFEGHRYSVPQSLVGQVLEARVTARTVELLHRGQRVASHLRCAHKGGFTTVPEHLSAARAPTCSGRPSG